MKVIAFERHFMRRGHSVDVDSVMAGADMSFQSCDWLIGGGSGASWETGLDIRCTCGVN